MKSSLLDENPAMSVQQQDIYRHILKSKRGEYWTNFKQCKITPDRSMVSGLGKAAGLPILLTLLPILLTLEALFIKDINPSLNTI